MGMCQENGAAWSHGFRRFYITPGEDLAENALGRFALMGLKVGGEPPVGVQQGVWSCVGAHEFSVCVEPASGV